MGNAAILINEKFLDGIRSITNICNIWTSLLCQSTQHNDGAGSCKYLEGPCGSNLVYYSCPWKSHSLGMVLDWYSDCSLVVWWRLPNLVEAVEYTENCCWECCYIGFSPQYEPHHVTFDWAFTSEEVYFVIWGTVEVNGAVHVMALAAMRWLVVTARVWA